MNVSELVQDTRNANKGTKRGRSAVAESLKRYGAGRSVLIDRNGVLIAGNKTASQAGAAGIDEVIVVQTNGRQLVAVQRTDLDITDQDAQALAIADNRVAELGLEWDKAQLADLVGLGDLDLKPFFTDDELGDLLEHRERTSENVEREAENGKYTAKIVTPVYEPKGEQPDVNDLCDDTKALKLLEHIRAAAIPDDVRAFLVYAAFRHVVFDYRGIAEYYCHAAPEVQALIEESALVILDFDKAIEQGYVDMTGDLMEIYGGSYDNAR